jgi:hypothetical protein
MVGYSVFGNKMSIWARVTGPIVCQPKFSGSSASLGANVASIRDSSRRYRSLEYRNSANQSQKTSPHSGYPLMQPRILHVKYFRSQPTLKPLIAKRRFLDLICGEFRASAHNRNMSALRMFHPHPLVPVPCPDEQFARKSLASRFIRISPTLKWPCTAIIPTT